MKKTGRPPIFLERQSYRQRRMMDALRLLPVLGLMLWMLPLFWPNGQGALQGVQASVAVSYIFGIWVLLILLSLALSIALRQRLSAELSTSDKRE